MSINLTRWEALYTMALLSLTGQMQIPPLIFPRRLSLAPLLTLSIIFLALSGCSRLPQAPDFRVTQFDGQEFHLAELSGRQAVVINFWYPSCPPCREEMPHFESTWQSFKEEDIRFLGLFVPMGFDSEQDARNFVDEFGLTFDFATDVQARTAQSYGVEYFPTTYFINKEGRVFRQEISNLDQERLTELITEMIDG